MDKHEETALTVAQSRLKYIPLLKNTKIKLHERVKTNKRNKVMIPLIIISEWTIIPFVSRKKSGPFSRTGLVTHEATASGS